VPRDADRTRGCLLWPVNGFWNGSPQCRVPAFEYCPASLQSTHPFGRKPGLRACPYPRTWVHHRELMKKTLFHIVRNGWAVHQAWTGMEPSTRRATSIRFPPFRARSSLHPPKRGLKTKERLNGIPGEPEVIVAGQDDDRDAAASADEPSQAHVPRSLEAKLHMRNARGKEESVGRVDEPDGGTVEFGQRDEELCDDDVSAPSGGQRSDGRDGDVRRPVGRIRRSFHGHGWPPTESRAFRRVKINQRGQTRGGRVLDALVGNQSLTFRARSIPSRSARGSLALASVVVSVAVSPRLSRVSRRASACPDGPHRPTHAQNLHNARENVVMKGQRCRATQHRTSRETR
jgi:hypothetical protein